MSKLIHFENNMLEQDQKQRLAKCKKYIYNAPYADIGASFQQKLIWSIVMVGLFFDVFVFKFGHTQNIVSK